MTVNIRVTHSHGLYVFDNSILKEPCLIHAWRLALFGKCLWNRNCITYFNGKKVARWILFGKFASKVGARRNGTTVNDWTNYHSTCLYSLTFCSFFPSFDVQWGKKLLSWPHDITTTKKKQKNLITFLKLFPFTSFDVHERKKQLKL